jgi:putative transposase
MKEKIDFEKISQEILQGLKEKKPLIGEGGIFTPLIKHFLESALEGEMNEHLQNREQSEHPTNRRNGKLKKSVKSTLGTIEIESPRDRMGTFEPQIIEKRQVRISEDMDRKIISMYGRGMSYSDIKEHMREMYDVDLSESLLTSVTDSLLPTIEQWRNRPLDSIYSVIFMDAMYFKVKEQDGISNKAMYSVLAVNIEGEKEILGIYIGESESASFWKSILNNLQDRGVSDILIACIDNLTGLAEAIEDFFPKTIVQPCLVHQMRNSFKYANNKDIKELAKDLKKVYSALTESEGMEALMEAENKWGKKYPAIFKSWKNNWVRIKNIYQFGPKLRRLIYTTNPIESYHRMIRKVTKSKGVFHSEKSVKKQVFLVIQNAQSKWKGTIFNWSSIRQDLYFHFSDRLSI